VLVDTEGFLLAAHVSPANATERSAAVAMLGGSLGSFPTIEVVWADEGYEGEAMEGWLEESWGVTLGIVKRSEESEGFEVLPRRWVVERTFAWLVRNRRLRSDYELLPESSEAFMYMAMSRLMLKRLARSAKKEKTAA
jgi:putative transposase